MNEISVSGKALGNVHHIPRCTSPEIQEAPEVPSLLHLWVFVFAVLSSEHASPHLCATGSFPSPRTPSDVTFLERSPRPSQCMTRTSLILCYLGTHSSEAELCSCPLSVFPHRMCPTRAIILANLLMASSPLSGTTQHVLIK